MTLCCHQFGVDESLPYCNLKICIIGQMSYIYSVFLKEREKKGTLLLSWYYGIVLLSFTLLQPLTSENPSKHKHSSFPTSFKFHHLQVNWSNCLSKVNCFFLILSPGKTISFLIINSSYVLLGNSSKYTEPDSSMIRSGLGFIFKS